MEDERIVELFFLRDENAIVNTREKYGRRLRNISLGIVCDEQTTEECENDTYLKAWSLIPPNEPKSYLYAFLAKIIRNISLNKVRFDKRLKRNALITTLSEEIEECIPSPDDINCRIDDMIFSHVINTFLGNLDEEKRNIFIRRYFFCDSITQISRRYGLSESKIKTTLFRCRKNLREYLQKEGYEL